jgi:3-hydroxyisobutyrate dehydrogenase
MDCPNTPQEHSAMAKVAFLGLGVMGYPMARHLKAKGHEVTVYNRTFAKAEKWVSEHGGQAARTPAEAAKGQEIVFACVGNDDDLRSVALGADGAFAGMTAGAIFVDHTTASANVARELHAAAKAKGVGFIDAPVSGGQAGAENGVLTVMCGGDADVFSKAEPVIMSFARACRLLGAPGAGQIAKMMNQIAIAGLVQGLSEAVHFGKRAGMDIDAVLDVISKGAA